MLNRMRRGVKSLTAKLLMLVLVASFAVWGIGDIFNFRLDASVARVGDTEVSAQRFADALARQQSRLSRQRGELVSFDQLRQSGISRSVLNSLIRDAAFEEELAELGISAPDAAVAERIRQNPAFQGPSGEFSSRFYQLSLQQQGMSASEFESLTRTLLAQDILMETARAGAEPPPGMAERIATYRGETREVDTLTLTADMAPEPDRPGSEALRTFYDENQDIFREPERRWGEHLHVDAERLKAELAPGEEELRQVYEAEKDRYTTRETRTVEQITFPERSTAERAVGRLAQGEATFDALAEEQGLSEDDIALGRVTPDDLPRTAAELVFDQDEPGVVGPVELPAGFAVYRVSEVSGGGTQPFEEVRDRIAERLAEDALMTRAPEIANRIEELRAAGRSFNEIARETAAVHGSFDGLAQDGTLADGSKADGIVARPAFIEEVFKALDREERDLVETDQGGYFLVMVERIDPSGVPPLDEVRDEVAAAWQERQRREALEERAGEIVARLGRDASLRDIAGELGVRARSRGPFTRLNAPNRLPRALVREVFRVEAGEGAFAAAEDQTRVVVAEVTGTGLPSDAQIAREREQIEGLLAESLRSDLGEYFARAVAAGHEVSVDQTVVNQVFQRLGGGGGQQPQTPAM